MNRYSHIFLFFSVDSGDFQKPPLPLPANRFNRIEKEMILPEKSAFQPPSICLKPDFPKCRYPKATKFNIETTRDWEIFQVNEQGVEGKMIGFLGSASAPTKNKHSARRFSGVWKTLLVLPEWRFWGWICGYGYSLVYGEIIFQRWAQQLTLYKQHEERIKVEMGAQWLKKEPKTIFINCLISGFKKPLVIIFSSQVFFNQCLSANEEENKKLPCFSEQFQKSFLHLGIMNGFLEGLVLLSSVHDKGAIRIQEAFSLFKFIRYFVNGFVLSMMKNWQLILFLPAKYTESTHDKLLLEHVLVNLIYKAFKYSFGLQEPKLKLGRGNKTYKLILSDYSKYYRKINRIVFYNTTFVHQTQRVFGEPEYAWWKSSAL
jgi:hypothetical protein